MSYLKRNGEAIGIPLLILGCVTLIVAFILTLMGAEVLYLIGLVLALFSVGLGLTAVGMSEKADKRHTELLERLDKNIARLPLMLKDDILTSSGQLIAKEIAKEEAGEQSKLAAEKRLDEDTKRVGYDRGEIYQVKNGSWAIAWGGKYPL